VATLRSDGEHLVLALRPLEKLAALHGDVRVPLDRVRSVRKVDPWRSLRGLRAPGTGIPHLVAYGTFRSRNGKDFAAVKGKGAAVLVELDARKPFARLLVSASDAGRVATRLRRVRRGRAFRRMVRR
jgi:hypothetical protein